MALSDMFGLLGGGGSSPYDIYGDLFTKEQKAALQQRQAGEGLLRMAGAFGAAAQPSRMPTSFMGALGQAAGSLAGSGDEAAKTAMEAMKTGEAVRASKQKRAGQERYRQIVEAALRNAGIDPASPQGRQAVDQALATPPTAPAAPQAPGAPAVSPGGGDLSGSTGTPGTVGDFPTGAASQRPGMPLPPETLGYMQPVPGQPPPGMAPGAERFWPAPTMPDQIQPWSGAQQNTGLLPPQDQMVGPDGQPLTGPGVLPRLAAGGGAPPPFQRVSSTPTSAATRGAGGDVVIPSGPRLQRSDLTNVAAPAGAFDQAVNYLQTELGLAPHQARGAVKWMHNVESKLDPNAVNPTSGALGVAQHLGPRKRALIEKYGPNPSYEQQLAFIKDELQGPEKAALNSLRNAGTENEAFRAWGKDFERPSAAEYAKAAGQDYVIPSGRGVPASALRNVADTGAAPGAGQVIPGLNLTPQQLGLLNALGDLNDIDSPFKSLLDTYYKSPGYIAEAERTRTQAQKDVEYKMDPLIIEQRKQAEYKVDMELKPKLEAAVARLQSPILKERAQAQADIDRITQQMKSAGDAALRPNDATVVGPGGVLTTQKITDLEFAQRQQDRAKRVAKGDTTMQPGDIVGTPIGAAPAEHEYVITPQGSISARAVPGTPAAQKAAEAEDKKRQTEQQNLIARDTVVREVDNIGKLMEDATLPTTGFTGSILQNLGGTAANDVRVARQTLESRLSRDALNAQRAASPTGAAFGNTSDADLAILRTSLVNLDQSQTKEQFRERLQILKQNYIDMVHGPGMSRLLPETQVLRSPQAPATTAPAAGAPINKAAYDALPSGSVFIAPDGSRRVKP